MPDDAFMAEAKIAFRAAIDVPGDLIQSVRSPSSLPLAADVAEAHPRAAECVEALLRRVRPRLQS
jgi:hypothetical protein